MNCQELDELSRCRSGRIDCQAQFALRGAQMLFRPGSMAFHVIVICGTGVLHLMDRFRDVFVNAVKIVPVAHLRRQRGARNE